MSRRNHPRTTVHASPRRRTIALATFGLALLIAVGCGAPARDTVAEARAQPSLSPILAPLQGALFGAWSGPPRNGRTWGQEMPYLESLIGRKYDLDSMYYFWEENFPGWHERDAVAAGRIPVILWASDWKSGGSLSWAAIAAGQHDAVINARADAIKAFGHKVMLIFQHEPEDDHDTNGTAAEYRAAYRHVITKMRARGATNIISVWNLMAWTFNAGGPVPEDYYPGDDVVDWIAADGYNWYGNPFNPGPWRSLNEIFWPFYTWGKAKRKPMMIAEFGSGEDSADPWRKARWLEDVAAQLKAWPEVKGIVYFHSLGWEFNSSANALDAYRRIAHDWHLDPLAKNTDRTLPGVTLTSPTSGATVSGTTNVTANASDNVGIARVDFLIGGVVKASDKYAPYTFAWNTASQPNGSTTVQARAYDYSNNAASSAAPTVVVSNANSGTVDSTKPLVAITSPANGGLVDYRKTVTINANASDNVGIQGIEFWVNGSLRCTDNVAPYSCDWYVWNTSGSTSWIRAQAYDPSGNTSTHSISVKTR